MKFLSYTINVDNQALFIEKFVVTADNLGQQPKMYEFIIPPNSTVKVQATESANNGVFRVSWRGIEYEIP